MFDKSSACNQLQENKTWFSLLGIGLIITGSLAIIYSFTSTIASLIYLGIFITALGLFEIAKATKISQWGHFFLHLFLGILFTSGGLFTVFHPAINAISLTLIIALFFIISGTLKLFFALTQQVPHKGWLLFNSLLSLVLGALIIYQWPVSGLWVIGTFVGIEMIFTGWSWLMLSVMANNVSCIP